MWKQVFHGGGELANGGPGKESRWWGLDLMLMPQDPNHVSGQQTTFYPYYQDS